MENQDKQLEILFPDPQFLNIRIFLISSCRNFITFPRWRQKVKYFGEENAEFLERLPISLLYSVHCAPKI